MPKMKTHRGMAKRVRKTGTGKLMRAKAFKSHILTKKTTKRTRHLRSTHLRRRDQCGCDQEDDSVQIRARQEDYSIWLELKAQ